MKDSFSPSYCKMDNTFTVQLTPVVTISYSNEHLALQLIDPEERTDHLVFDKGTVKKKL